MNDHHLPPHTTTTTALPSASSLVGGFIFTMETAEAAQGRNRAAGARDASRLEPQVCFFLCFLYLFYSLIYVFMYDI
jgi:hypothetical protein